MWNAIEELHCGIRVPITWELHVLIPLWEQVAIQPANYIEALGEPLGAIPTAMLGINMITVILGPWNGRRQYATGMMIANQCFLEADPVWPADETGSPLDVARTTKEQVIQINILSI